jgi:hypothetical protein
MTDDSSSDAVIRFQLLYFVYWKVKQFGQDLAVVLAQRWGGDSVEYVGSP